MIPSLAWWMCLGALTKLRNIGIHFSEEQPSITSRLNQQAFICFDSICVVLLPIALCFFYLLPLKLTHMGAILSVRELQF